MRRILVASLVGVLLTATSALASEENGTAVIAPAVTAAATSLAQRTDLTAINLAARLQNTPRPLALPALYAGSALLQGYDAYSTLTVIKRGGVEANPLMKSVTRNPAAFIGLKAGMTVMSIMAAERLWKGHNRMGAVLTMVASNGFMAMVAAHNASVMARMK